MDLPQGHEGQDALSEHSWAGVGPGSSDCEASDVAPVADAATRPDTVVADVNILLARVNYVERKLLEQDRTISRQAALISELRLRVPASSESPEDLAPIDQVTSHRLQLLEAKVACLEITFESLRRVTMPAGLSGGFESILARLERLEAEYQNLIHTVLAALGERVNELEGFTGIFMGPRSTLAQRVNRLQASAGELSASARDVSTPAEGCRKRSGGAVINPFLDLRRRQLITVARDLLDELNHVAAPGSGVSNNLRDDLGRKVRWLEAACDLHAVSEAEGGRDCSLSERVECCIWYIEHQASSESSDSE